MSLLTVKLILLLGMQIEAKLCAVFGKALCKILVPINEWIKWWNTFNGKDWLHQAITFWWKMLTKPKKGVKNFDNFFRTLIFLSFIHSLDISRSIPNGSITFLPKRQFSPRPFSPWQFSLRLFSHYDISPAVTSPTMTFLPKRQFSLRHFSQHYFSHISFSRF